MIKKPNFHILLLSMMLLSGLRVMAQQSRQDSLLSQIKLKTEDTNKVNSYNALASLFVNNNPDTCIYFAKKGTELSLKLNFNKGKAEGFLYMGMAQSNIGKWNEAMHSLSVALEIAKQRNDAFYEAKIYTNIGNLFTDEGRYPEALNSHFTALKIRESLKIEDKKGVAGSLTNIGVVYRLQGNYNEALTYYSRALRIKLAIEDKKGIANLYTNIGNLYMLQLEYEKALRSYKSSLEMYQALNDTRGISACYNNIGSVYSHTGEYAEALNYFLKYLEIKIASSDKIGIAGAYLNIGNVLYLQKKNEKAQEYFQKAKVLSEEVGSSEYLRDIYFSLSKLDSAVGNFKSALSNYHLYVQFRDSLNNDENLKKSVRTQMQYDFDKQSTTDSISNVEKIKQDNLKHEHEIQQQKTYTYVGVGGFLLMVLVAGVSFRAFRQKQKANAIISHQKALMEEKQKEILDSIHYAKRIQESLLPSVKYIQKNIERLKNQN